MKPETAVHQIMTTELITVRPETAASQVKAIFDLHDFHHLPVVSEGNRLEGIISRKDFSKVAYVLSLNTSGRSYSEAAYENLSASDFMTQYPVALDPEDSVGLAADIFMANKFHALPIIEEAQLVGLITTHDLLLYSYQSPLSSEQASLEIY
ncbi:MAG: CBS domain-containing protein [Bacteroidota bacterium]